MTSLLDTGAEGYRWVAATARSQSAASYQLASGHAVMAVGGFNGTVSYPTLAQFQDYVDNGEIHYFIGGGLGGQPGSGESTTSQIEQWVAANFSSTEVGGTTVYDLSSPLGTSTTSQSGVSA
ncbi:hypothetical protein [Nocardioides sp.]|uniref:hypothetical protein n=1 Tax=Nocardioides sp. TaxID=35761 RepID=UPI0039E544F3